MKNRFKSRKFRIRHSRNKKPPTTVAASTALAPTNLSSQTELRQLSRTSFVQLLPLPAQGGTIVYAKFDKNKQPGFEENPQNFVTEIPSQLKEQGFNVAFIRKYYVGLDEPVEIEFLLNINTKKFMTFTTGLYDSSLTPQQRLTM